MTGGGWRRWLLNGLALMPLLALSYLWVWSGFHGFNFTWKLAGGSGVFARSDLPGTMEMGIRTGAGWRVGEGPAWTLWETKPQEGKPLPWPGWKVTSVPPFGQYSLIVSHGLLVAVYSAGWLAALLWRLRTASGHPRT